MDQDLKNSILKTGTTILGIVCKNGIVMAADKQSTAGMIVMSKKSEKAVKINDYLIFAGTGSVSDIQRLKKITAAELRLKELRSRSRPTVKQSANLISTLTYSQVRQMSAIPTIVGSLIAGFNENGTTELYTVDPAGAIVKVDDYDANFGSGLFYVLGFLERQYKKGIDIKEGIELAVEAIKSATQRDTGSGYGIDVFTITKDGIKKVVDQEIISEYKDSKKQ